MDIKQSKINRLWFCLLILFFIGMIVPMVINWGMERNGMELVSVISMILIFPALIGWALTYRPITWEQLREQ